MEKQVVKSIAETRELLERVFGLEDILKGAYFLYCQGKIRPQQMQDLTSGVEKFLKDCGYPSKLSANQRVI